MADSCEECRNCIIYVDRDVSMRWPSGRCSLGLKIEEVDCCEWLPTVNPCREFVPGDPEYL